MAEHETRMPIDDRAGEFLRDELALGCEDAMIEVTHD